jgi:hypothetical protein
MRAIVRRLARLEDRYVPREDAESERLYERLCRARGRHTQRAAAVAVRVPLMPKSMIPSFIQRRWAISAMEEIQNMKTPVRFFPFPGCHSVLRGN